eukprot:TRINITY_DN4790_c0_g1_i2.p1 TRINITY_DN4790_c0_g1~~TRINITY_DN4790_c0_g1_i2.p1  ORF type:complete len:155 (+),score=16.00 TRINITY_DN4790_c0_g1_i2:213-677(+)
MGRYATRRKADEVFSSEQIEGVIDKVVAIYTESGVLNDNLFSQRRIQLLRERGKSKRFIEADLRNKKIPSDLISEFFYNTDSSSACSDGNHADPELEAALKFAKKIKIGPYRRDPIDLSNHTLRREVEQKEMAKLARAGFGYRIAQKVIHFSIN